MLESLWLQHKMIVVCRSPRYERDDYREPLTHTRSVIDWQSRSGLLTLRNPHAVEPLAISVDSLSRRFDVLLHD